MNYFPKGHTRKPLIQDLTKLKKNTVNNKGRSLEIPFTVPFNEFSSIFN